MMKPLKNILSVLLALTILSSAFVLATNTPPPPTAPETITIVRDKGVSQEVIASENATEVFLPASFGYRVPENACEAENSEFAKLLFPHATTTVSKAASAQTMKAEQATEIFMEPVRIDDSTYEYYDDEGVLFGTLVLPDNTSTTLSISNTRAEVYTFDWTIPANSYTHGDIALDAAGSAAEIHHSAICFGDTSTYVGYYTPNNSTYHWLNPPSATKLEGYFILADSQSVHFALKNASNQPGTYTGGYWTQF